MTTEPNPYAPPRIELPEHPSTDDWFAVCTYRSWGSRKVLLAGSINAEIRYEAWGHGERVYVNDLLAARTSAWHFHCVAPHVDFAIECPEGSFTGAIDVQVSFFQLLRITKFTLKVNGQVAYTD